ncbi:MAG: hypothetical protein HY350_00495 [Candidatus Omnitrophica bacterium]|nr:hypothetical protein [Candidatus Omnitrophota bacterium]
MLMINASQMPYRLLNEKIRSEVKNGEKEFKLSNINGHRYIGSGISGDVKFFIDGVPGNDLGAFMDGPTIIVSDNAQDGVGNTMNNGKVVINGSAGDVLGYGMRGGRIYIEKNAGYRVGIHMKSFKEQIPVIVIGGCARDFLGEYMGGGVIIVLGQTSNGMPVLGNFVGTGMHGGTIYVRGKIENFQLGKEVGFGKIVEEDLKALKEYLSDYCGYFGLDPDKLLREPFVKLYPYSTRPYGKIYAH